MITGIGRRTRSGQVSLITKSICMYLLSIPFDFVPIGALGSISKLVVILPLMVSLINYRAIKYTGKVGILLLALFAISCGFSSLLSNRFSESLSDYISMLQNVVIIMLFSGFAFSRQEIRYIENTVLLSGLIIFGLIFISSYSGETGRQGITVFGVEQNLNYTNGYILLPQSICLSRLLREKKIRYLGFYLMSLAVTLLTGSRGGLISSIIILFIHLNILSFAHSKKYIRKVGLLFIEIAIVAIVFLMFEYLVPENLKQRYSIDSIISDKGSNRILIWTSMLQAYGKFNIFQQLFGVGIGMSPYYAYNGFYVAHNAFIAYLLETGIVGLALYIALLFQLLKWSFRTHADSAIAALFGFIAMASLSSLTNFKPLWVVMFFTIVCINRFRLEPLIFRSE